MPEKLMHCNICLKELKSFHSFPNHLVQKHGLNTRQYYDEFFRSGSDGLCLVCSGSTGFINLALGYREFCSHECADCSDIVRERRAATTIERYGVVNAFQSEEKKQKSRETLLERYGVDHPMKSEIIIERMKETNLERYGNEWQIASSGTREAALKTLQGRYGCDNPFQDEAIRIRTRETNLERYGVEWPLLSMEIDQKARDTMVSRHGVEWAMQAPTLLDKQQKSALTIETVTVEGKDFQCQGYEEHFLRRCGEFGLSVHDLTDDVPSIPYFDTIGSKWRRYVPDFLHTPTGTVIEVKSTWTYDGNGIRLEWREQNRCKMSGTIQAGHEFLMVVLDGDRGCLWSAKQLEELR